MTRDRRARRPNPERTVHRRAGRGLGVTLLACVATAVGCGDGDPLLFPEATSLESVTMGFQEGTVGEAAAAPPRVRVLDRRGNPAPGAEVEWSVTRGDGEVSQGTTRSDEAGIAALERWTLGTAAGDNGVLAALPGRASVEFSALARPGPPDSLLRSTGHQGFGTVGRSIPVLPRVLVVDAFDNPVEGVEVSFRLLEGEGSLQGPEAVSDAQGHASPLDWTLGPAAGVQSLEARAGSLTPVRFDVTARADVPDSVDVLEAGAAEARVGETVTGIVVEARDRFQNPVEDVELEVRVVAGGGSVLPNPPVTDHRGQAVLDWVLGPTAGTQRLEVRADSARYAVLEIEVAPGDPAELVPVGGQGQVAPANQAVPDPPAVRVTDGFGNPLEGVDVIFDVVLGGGSIQGTPARSDVHGVAALTRWTLGPEPGENRVEARLAGLQAVTFTAEATEAVIRGLQVVQGADQEGSVGFPVPEAPGVRLVDQDGVPVPDEEVTFTVVEGGGSVTPTPLLTDADGRAVTDEWTLGPSPGWNRIRVAAVGAPALTISAWAEAGLQLVVEEVHVNQGSQTFPASIPLLEGRGGLVRVFLRANLENDGAPRVRLEFFDGDALVSSHVVNAPTGSVATSPDPENPAHSWDVEIPGGLVGPNFGVRVHVDEDEEVEVVDRTQLAWPTDGSVHRPPTLATAPFRSTFVVIESTDLETVADLRPGNLDEYLWKTLDLFPIADHDAMIRPDTFVSDAAPLTGSDQGDGWAELVQEILALRFADGDTDPDAFNRYYHGILRRASGPGIAGIAYIATTPNSGALAAVSHDAEGSRARVVAHEFGHNFGRRHTPCGGAGGLDPNWPTDPAYDGARIGVTGYSLASGQLILGSGSARDIMSYCAPVWSSDYTFAAILGMREARPIGIPPAVQPAPPGRGLLVWGSWGRDRGPRLRPAVELRSRELPARVADAVIRGFDAEGGLVFERGVEGLPLDHADDPTLRQFTTFVALDDGERESLARLVLDSPEGQAELVAPGAGGPAGAPGADPAPDPGLEIQRLGSPGVQGAPGAERLRVRWHHEDFPFALVRDGPDGRVLGMVRSGDVVIPHPASGTLTVEFSDGVRTVRRSVSDY